MKNSKKIENFLEVSLSKDQTIKILGGCYMKVKNPKNLRKNIASLFFKQIDEAV